MTEIAVDEGDTGIDNNKDRTREDRFSSLPESQIITRIFSLAPIRKNNKKNQKQSPGFRKFIPTAATTIDSQDLDQVFGIHQQAVNLFMDAGREEPYELFAKQQLTSVKTFYDTIRKVPHVHEQMKILRHQPQLGRYQVKERVFRCAAQEAYFTIRDYKRRARRYQVISQELQGQWPGYSRFGREEKKREYNKYRSKRQQPYKRQFPTRGMLRAVRHTYVESYGEYDGLEKRFMEIQFTTIRKLVYRQLVAEYRDLRLVDVLGKNTDNTENSENHEQQEFGAYCWQELQQQLQQSAKIEMHDIDDTNDTSDNHVNDTHEKILQYLAGSYLRSVSMRLTRAFNRYRKLLRAGKEVEIHYPLLRNYLRDSVFRNSGNSGKRELGEKIRGISKEQWEELRLQWRAELQDTLQDMIRHLDLQELIKEVIAQLEMDTKFWRLACYGKLPAVDVGSTADTRGFSRFLHSWVYVRILPLALYYYRRELRGRSDRILQQIIDQPERWMSTPQYAERSIALGIDDGQLYDQQMSADGEVEIMLSLQCYKKVYYHLRAQHRFDTLVKKGWEPRRGMLTYDSSKDKLLLHLPFEKQLRAQQSKYIGEEMISDRVLGIDLGLKTLATMSLMEDGQEIDRRFVDVRHLVGPAEQWWWTLAQLQELLTEEELEERLHQQRKINLKGRLIRLQDQTRRARSQMDLVKKQWRAEKQPGDRSYTCKRAYWYARRKFKESWQRVARLHNEIAAQLGRRIACYARAMGVERIQVEDLSWSRRRKNNGKYLTTWQAHWYHGQMQRAIRAQAERVGIVVVEVNPRYTSRTCSSCGVRGQRDGKRFVCENCGLQLDSDLNAARNIAKL